LFFELKLLFSYSGDIGIFHYGIFQMPYLPEFVQLGSFTVLLQGEQVVLVHDAMPQALE